MSFRAVKQFSKFIQLLKSQNCDFKSGIFNLISLSNTQNTATLIDLRIILQMVSAG